MVCRSSNHADERGATDRNSDTAARDELCSDPVSNFPVRVRCRGVGHELGAGADEDACHELRISLGRGSQVYVHWGLTFDVGGGFGLVKPAQRRPLMKGADHASLRLVPEAICTIAARMEHHHGFDHCRARTALQDTLPLRRTSFVSNIVRPLQWNELLVLEGLTDSTSASSVLARRIWDLSNRW